MENRHKTARNAVKRCKRAKRSGREAKLLVCNRSVSHGCGRSQSAGTVTAQTIMWQTCGFLKRFDEPCAFPGKVKGQHRCGRMSCSHISGMLRAVTCDGGPSVFTWASWDRPLRAPRSGRRPLFGPFGGCFVIVRLLILDDVFLALFGYLWFFSCSFIFVCCFLAVFGAFPVILWSFYVRQFLFCGCFFNHRSCLCDAGFCVWWCSVVLFVVILCLLLLFCVFVIISLFLVVVYFFWSDITFVKTPRPLRKYDRPTQHQWSRVMLWCWVWCCVILIVCNIKVTAEWMNVWYQCERLQLLLASLTLTLWPGV